MDSLPSFSSDSHGYTLIEVLDIHARMDSEEWMAVFDAIIQQGSRGVIIDCNAVVTPSSPFMSALAWCRQLAHKNGFDTCIIHCHGRLKKALEVTELTRVLLIAEDHESAQKVLSEG